MTNAEFIHRLSQKVDMTESLTMDCVNQFIGIILRELSSGKVVSVQGFGNFESREKAERKMFNPSTRTYKLIPKKTVLGFKMSGTLKDKINN